MPAKRVLHLVAVVSALALYPAAGRGADGAARVAEASADLAAVRKVALKAAPPVEEVSRERYVEEYVIPTLDQAWGGDFAKSLEAFKALGMIPQDLDARPFLRRYGAAMTAAGYDYLRKRILVPGDTLSRETLVHELMHASQDERHDLKALMAAARGNIDETLARGALVEGEALDVQLRHQMGPSRMAAGVVPYGTLRDEARAYFENLNRNAQAILPGAPPAVLRAQAFVYEEGVLFVERLRRRERNWAAVDAAYRMPPRSTAHILHPEKYLAGEQPIELTIAGKERLLGLDAPLVAENTLGEFGMRLFLMSHGSDAEAAARAALGWRGDRVFLYRSDRDKSGSLVWVSTWETAERAKAVAGVLSGAFRGSMLKAVANDVIFLAGDGIPAVLDVKIIRKPSAEGRPLGGQDEKE